MIMYLLVSFIGRLCSTEHRVDDLDLKGANAKLNAEIKKNEATVSEAKGAKRRIDAAEKSLAAEKEASKKLRHDKKRIYDQLRYHKQQDSVFREQHSDCGDIEKLRSQFEKLWNEFDEMRQAYDNLQAEVVEKEEELERLREEAETMIKTTDNAGSYTPRFRLLVQQILAKNVPQEHVSPIIEEVLTFAARKATKLPTLKTIRQINFERLPIAQRHVGVSWRLCYSIFLLILLVLLHWRHFCLHSRLLLPCRK